MQYRILGNTGLKVSVFSLGTWITFNNFLAKNDVNTFIDYAFTHGINLFDTAEVYGEGKVESILGEALHHLKLPREKYLLCTKVFWGGNNVLESGLTRKHIIDGCNRSLKRLKTDYIDFYLCHRPDPDTPVEETIIAMNGLIQQGKILYWGTSEWPPELITEAYFIAKQSGMIPPSVDQFEYNMFCRTTGEKHFPMLNKKTGIGSLITMPLANGILAGRYNHSLPNDSRAQLKTHPYFSQLVASSEGQNKISMAIQLEQLANQMNIKLPQLVLQWCLYHDTIHSIILGVSKLSQLQENISSLTLFDNKKNVELMQKIDEIILNKPLQYYNPSYNEVVAES